MSKGKAIGGLAAMLAIALPVVAMWEGKSTDPYKDLVGKWTVCFGETNVPMRRYTDAECEAMLTESLGEYGLAVVERNPSLANRPYQWAAASSLAFNIGTSAYRRSTVARRFSQGRWREACDAFLMWRYAGGREVRGLLNRRRHEREICLTGVPLVRSHSATP